LQGQRSLPPSSGRNNGFADSHTFPPGAIYGFFGELRPLVVLSQVLHRANLMLDYIPYCPRLSSAIGRLAVNPIDRTIYHGAYPEGTAVRFESFELWGLDY
jgi:hypothetical protein